MITDEEFDAYVDEEVNEDYYSEDMVDEDDYFLGDCTVNMKEMKIILEEGE